MGVTMERRFRSPGRCSERSDGLERQAQNPQPMEGLRFAVFAKLRVGDKVEIVADNSSSCDALELRIVGLKHIETFDAGEVGAKAQANDASRLVNAILHPDQIPLTIKIETIDAARSDVAGLRKK